MGSGALAAHYHDATETNLRLGPFLVSRSLLPRNGHEHPAIAGGEASHKLTVNCPLVCKTW